MKQPLLCCIAFLALAVSAHATFTLTLSQVGNNVVVNGSGTLDTTALTLQPPNLATAAPGISRLSRISLPGCPLQLSPSIADSLVPPTLAPAPGPQRTLAQATSPQCPPVPGSSAYPPAMFPGKRFRTLPRSTTRPSLPSASHPLRTATLGGWVPRTLTRLSSPALSLSLPPGHCWVWER